MNNSISERICRWFCGNGIIKPEEIELYQFGLHYGAVMLFNLLTTLAVGAVFGMLWECLLFSAFYIALRVYAGGYHAKTQGTCYVFSVVLICGALILIRVIAGRFWLCGALSLGCLAVIWRLAPVESPHKRLKESEKAAYKHKVRARLLAYQGLEFLFLFLRYPYTAAVISAAMAVAAVMLLLGRGAAKGLLEMR